MTPAELDDILTLQLAVAWAGEANTRPARLCWWRTALSDAGAGEDLLRRLTPRTWAFATLEATRKAARRVDDAGRKRSEDADHLVSLFRLGFEIDEQLDDRLRDLKQTGATPSAALPRLGQLLDATPGWSRDGFQAWLGSFGPGDSVRFTTTPTGRRLTGELPGEVPVAARRLAAALPPLADAYPLPHFRVAR